MQQKKELKVVFVFCFLLFDFANFSDNMVRNKHEQADGTLVHLHKSSLGVQNFSPR